MPDIASLFTFVSAWIGSLTLDTVLNGISWLCGTLGAIAFAFNLAPQVVTAYHRKEVGLSKWFFVLAYIGNIGCAIMVFRTNWVSGVWQYPLYGNYLIAFTLTLTLNLMKLKYKK